MPRVAPVQSIRLSGFDGGLNTDADEFQLEQNESPDCLNVDFGLRGAVSKRKGYERYDDTVSPDMWRGLYRWNQRGGDDLLVAVDNDSAAWGDAATLTIQALGWDAPVDKADWAIGFAAYENKLYISSLNGNTWEFDGSTFTELTDTDLDGTSPTFPQAAHLETNYERVWAANVTANAVRYASRIWYSNIGDALTWDALDWIDVDPDDGDEISAMKVFGGNLMIWKTRAVYTLSGTDENTFTLFPLDRDIGTNAPRTVQSQGDRLIFFDPLTGVWQFDGAGFDKLDDKINLFLLDGINYAFSHRSSAFIWQGKYYLSIPWGLDEWPSRTFVLDLRNGAWTQYNYGMAAWINRDDDVYAVTPDGTAGLFAMFEALDDDGTAISSYMETSWLSPENEAVKQRMRRIDFAFSAINDTDVTVEFRRNFAIGPTYTQTVNTDPGGALFGTAVFGTDRFGLGVDQVLIRTTGWGNRRWRVMQLRFEENSLEGEWQLNRTIFHFSSLERVRGES
jgi:hypothetical protein